MITGTKALAALALFVALASAAQAQTNELAAAARATKIEGRWASEAVGGLCRNPKATESMTIEIKPDGGLVRSYWDFGSNLVEQYAIKRAEGNAVFVVETSPNPASEKETSFTVTGDRLIFYRPQRNIPGEFMKPASTQGYKRCE